MRQTLFSFTVYASMLRCLGLLCNGDVFCVRKIAINLTVFCIVSVLALFSPSVRGASYPYASVVGDIKAHTIVSGETLLDVARKYSVGIELIELANAHVDRWVPEEGAILDVPAYHIIPALEPNTILVNLAELRLYYRLGDKVYTYPVSTGTQAHQTPIGHTKIIKKRVNPAWIPPASMRKENPSLPNIMPAGPNNPLGDYAMNLDWQSIIIHGTNKPWSIGRYASHGCIRMYPEDIKDLFSLVKVGVPVRVTNESVKLGWHENVLYLEVHPKNGFHQKTGRYHSPLENIMSVYADIEAFAGEESYRLDWRKIDQTLRSQRGTPVAVMSEGFSFGTAMGLP